MVGMVVTISPSFSLYKIVVLPAASRPTIRIRISRFENNLENSLVNVSPIAAETPPGRQQAFDGSGKQATKPAQLGTESSYLSPAHPANRRNKERQQLATPRRRT